VVRGATSMRILVLVKEVPEVSDLELDPVTRRLRREGVATLINPFDRRAVLEATRLRTELGGSIAVLSMGPPQTERSLRECLGLGVDRAFHLCDPAFAGADTLATARTLARAARKIGFDLILAGRYSIDSDTGQVGPEVAALLGIPFLGGVRRLVATKTEAGARLEVECEGDDGFADLACETPAVVTCTDRWKTRVPRVLPDDEAAEQARVTRWTSADLGGAATDYGQAGSPTWVEEVQPVESKRARLRHTYADEPEATRTSLLATVESARSAARSTHRGTTPQHPRRTDPSGGVWVIGERAPDGGVRPVTWELLGAADALARATSTGTSVFLLDPHLPPDRIVPRSTDHAALAGELGARGGDVLLLAEGDRAGAAPERALACLEAAIREYAPRIVLAPATSLGRERIPQVAARLGLGLTGDAIGVALDGEGRLRQLKPAFGGQVVAPILTKTRPEMATLRPGVLDPALPDAGRPAAERIALRTTGPAAERIVCSRLVEEVDRAGADLEEARIVVCVGFGLGEAGVARAQELASRLGGVVAGTRRVCDLGWLPRQMQVGISGRSVAPDLYVALGVRGSFNHMVGIRRAQTVVAVNRDPEAEVFAGADLGIVGDATEVLEMLISALS